MALFIADGDRFVPTDYARGPWSPDSLHGGPPAALLARAFEQHEVGDPKLVARVTVEILRPVPVAPLQVAVRTVRPGKRVEQLEAVLSDDEHELCRATAWRIREAEVELTDDVEQIGAPALPSTTSKMDAEWPWQAFHNEGVEMRYVEGSFDAPGPCTSWIRLRVPVVEGEEPSGIQRLVAAADFGNGISHVLPMNRFLFINPDLTVYAYRQPVGEWMCLQSRTHHGPTGTGLAESALYDCEGHVGRSAQSLLLDHR
ncbi:MAG TPA: thioesterase family protein [Acidimicrobiales bacterium]|nr:thioesterase family protein [Acidimicrobiales bacterium]